MQFGLTQSQLKDLGVIFGCDFTVSKCGVKGIGPVNGPKLLKKYGNLENVLKARNYSNTEIDKFLEARAVFDEADLIKTNPSMTELISFNVDRVNSFIEEYNLNGVGSEIEKLWRSLKEQSRLDDYISLQARKFSKTRIKHNFKSVDDLWYQKRIHDFAQEGAA